MKRLITLCLLGGCFLSAPAQNYVSQAWVADQGNGTYKNPVLYADYSDPDVCRVGDDYYLTSSSFNCLPGLQILHSKDLVNWTIIGAAVPYALPPVTDVRPEHGNRVWAPSIRHHNGEFYIFWGDPDQGAFMVKAKDPKGPWSEPVLVKAGKGIIDTTPLWDDDGRVYLVHAYAGSRAGLKSVITICELSADASKAITQSRIISMVMKHIRLVKGPNSINVMDTITSSIRQAAFLQDGKSYFAQKRIRSIRMENSISARQLSRQRASSRRLGRHPYGRRLVYALPRRRSLRTLSPPATYEMG